MRENYISCRKDISATSAKNGFTLVELVIVVAIVAVIAAIAVPSFVGFIQKSRVKNATEEIYGLLNQAKSEAVMRDTDIFVSIDEDDWCVGYSTVANCDCTAALADAGSCKVDVAGTDVMRVVDSGDFENVTIDSNIAASTIDHNRGTAAAGTVQIISGSWSLGITQSALGRLRICEPAVANGVKPVSRNVYTACP